MTKDIHNSVFDEGTKIKLYVLEQYLLEWLPVFLKKRNTFWDKIFIYDFFAGEGTDLANNFGSPLIILNQINSFCRDIVEKQLSVKLIFNEIIESKYHKLVKLCEERSLLCKSNQGTNEKCPNFSKPGDCSYELVIRNDDFQTFFDRIYSTMQQYPKYPRFMFLDQYGIKYITSEIFSKLVSLERTDFIFFISSSFARRFIEIPEFRKYLDMTRQQFSQNKPYHCHRVIYNYYKSLLPQNKTYYLAPFSIKKGKNIYGLIFGSNHTLGIEKFLNVCWKINPQTGDANFDIDKEGIDPDRPSLFEEFNIPTKIQYFQKELRDKIQNHQISNNKEIYNFTFEMGCLPAHANQVIKKLQKEKILSKKFKIANQNIHRLEISEIS